MKIMIKFLWLIVFTLSSIVSFSQEEKKDPAKIKLIEDLISEGQFHKVFYVYGINKINSHGQENDWTESQINSVKELLNFEDVRIALLNAYDVFSESELKELNKIFKRVNRNNKNGFTTMVPLSFILIEVFNRHYQKLIESA